MSSSANKGLRAAGRPPGASGVRTRSEILDAAVEAFAESGYEATSVRELTRRLGVSHNLVHHYFESKLALWQAAVHHGLAPTVRDIGGLFNEPAEGDDHIAIFRTATERSLLFLTEHPAAARMLLDESARGGERLDYIFDQLLKPVLTSFIEFISSARGQGLPDVDPRVLLLFGIGAMTTFWTQAGLADKMGIAAPASEGVLDAHAQALVDLITAAITNSTEPDEPSDGCRP